ncbi:MAG: xylulokinase [Lachnospiraceae bacterium]|jgi:sugar (pentulose or hexulose) kinase
MTVEQIKTAIDNGQTILGIEFGSTRIKSVMLGPDHLPIASGSFTWENRYENGLWTYYMDDAWEGLRESYKALADDVFDKYGTKLKKIGAIGISGMMHGYLPFDRDGNQIDAFRTWRNTNTSAAAAELTKLFDFNVPLRWSISQLYQSILENMDHVKDLDYMTTLSSYIHWQLTGEKVIGIGEASGMFPIDSAINDYDQRMLDQFEQLIVDKNYKWRIRDVLPKVLVAGKNAGYLTPEGAAKLDPSGLLEPGIPMAPPEGDAGTGMVATDSVGVRTGNVSAGTSIFSMIVLEKQLSRVYEEIDMVTTPCGKPVAMVHCNNCTSDFDAWTGLFSEVIEASGNYMDKDDLFTMLYTKSLEGDPDCGGIMVYNYVSGEPVTGLLEGRPLVIRKVDAKFTLANFLRAEIYSAFAALRIGMGILDNENVVIDRLMGHGGLFKTPGVSQCYLAAATGAEVSVMKNAGEGGPYGMALLADYMVNRKDSETLDEFLDGTIFSSDEKITVSPDQETVDGYRKYLDDYITALGVEEKAVELF